MEKMEALLMRVNVAFTSCVHPVADSVFVQLRPDADLNSALGPPIVRDSWKDGVSDASPPPTRPKPTIPAKAMFALSSPPPAHRASADDDSDTDSHKSDPLSSEDDIGELSLIGGVKRLTVHGLQPADTANEGMPVMDSQLRYHGKSSQFKLIGAARRLKEQYAGEVRASADKPARAESEISTTSSTCTSAREEYWSTPAWELEWEGVHAESPLPVIPEVPADLAASLINFFFEHVNTQWPLLHRPTFERQRARELHTRDIWFACLCQSIFAVASRWSDDPRVLSEGFDKSSEIAWHKAGWKFFESAVEVHQARRSIVTPAGLFEVQTLSVRFCSSSLLSFCLHHL
jgi:hypothetical protein